MRSRGVALYLAVALMTLIASTAVVFAVIAETKVSRLAAQADKSARVSCERSKTFGPSLALGYARYRFLSPSALEAYRATLPTSCP